MATDLSLHASPMHASSFMTPCGDRVLAARCRWETKPPGTGPACQLTVNGARRVDPLVLGNRIPGGFVLPIIAKLYSSSTTRRKAQSLGTKVVTRPKKPQGGLPEGTKPQGRKGRIPLTCSSTMVLAGRSTTPVRTRSLYCTKEAPIGVANRASIDPPNYVPGPDPHSTPNARSDGSSAATKNPASGTS